MAIKIKLRRDTSLNWGRDNPILDEGEPGFETDTLQFKIGNGSANWTGLNYVKFAGSIDSIVGLDTSNVIENQSLYFTNSRVYANVSQIGYTSNAHLANALILKANTSDLSTSIVPESGNLYFTNSRSVNAFTPSDKIVINSNGYITISVPNLASELSLVTNETIYANVGAIKTFTGAEENLTFTANVTNNNYVYVQAPLRIVSLPQVQIDQFTATEGTILFDFNNKQFKGYNGSHWVTLG